MKISFPFFFFSLTRLIKQLVTVKISPNVRKFIFQRNDGGNTHCQIVRGEEGELKDSFRLREKCETGKHRSMRNVPKQSELMARWLPEEVLE